MYNLMQIVTRVLAAIAFLSSSSAYSESIDQFRSDSQGLKSQAEWRDSNDQVITSLGLSFDQAAPEYPEEDLNSQPSYFKLTKFFGNSGAVELISPSRCRIGSINIPDDKVVILINGQPKNSGNLISITKNKVHKISIRFVGNDSSELATGWVSCSAGALRSRKGNAILKLDVSGEITNVTWEDEQRRPIKLANLSFDGIKAGDSNSSVMSNSVVVYFKSVSLPIEMFVAKTPTDCTIGSTAINPGDVYLTINGVRVNSGEAIRLAEGQPQEIRLVFAGEGSYGDRTGTVTCTSGSLMPEYKGQEPLELRVSGAIISESMWRDADGRPVEYTEFDFVPSSDGQPDSDTDSMPQILQLKAAPESQGLVQVQAPRYCRIGSDFIGDSYISVVINNTPVENGGTIYLPINTLHEIKIRFKKDGLGNYREGQVTCYVPGQMEYLMKSDEKILALYAYGYISTTMKSK